MFPRAAADYFWQLIKRRWEQRVFPLWWCWLQCIGNFVVRVPMFTFFPQQQCVPPPAATHSKKRAENVYHGVLSCYFLSLLFIPWWKPPAPKARRMLWNTPLWTTNTYYCHTWNHLHPALTICEAGLQYVMSGWNNFPFLKVFFSISVTTLKIF